MILRKSFLIVFLFILYYVGVAADRPLLFSENSLEEIQYLAAEKDQPYFLYFYSRDSRQCRKMKRSTWSDENLKRFVSKNFLALDIDALNTEVEVIQEFEVYSFPTIIFFRPDGSIMGKAKGYLAPETIYSILKKHKNTIQQQKQTAVMAMAKQQQAIEETEAMVKAEEPVIEIPAIQPQTEMAIADAMPQMVSRGMDTPAETDTRESMIIDMNAPMVSRGQISSQLHLDIPGLEPYSLKRLAMQPGQDVYGILVDSHTSFRAFNEKVMQLKKFWKGEIWVYAEEVSGVPVYKMVLGAYATREEADGIATTIYKFARLNTSILNLGYLKR